MEKTSQCSNLKQEIFKKGEKIKKSRTRHVVPPDHTSLGTEKYKVESKSKKVLLDDICWFQEKWFESQVIYFYSSILATCGNSC